MPILPAGAALATDPAVAADVPGFTALSGVAGPLGVSLPALGPWVLIVFGAAALIAYFVLEQRRKQAKQASLHRLLARSPGWYATAHPCGLSPDQLADLSGSTPRGDRRYGVRYGIGGPLSVPVPDHTEDVEAAFFQWYSEERSTNCSSKGVTTTSYRERREVVGIIRLPVACQWPVRIGPESVFGRIGLSRTDEQLESDAFNRQFRVEGRNRTLTVQLLDANLQAVLLDRFRNRTIDLMGNLLVLGGTPTHRDDSLTGVIGTYPAVREDVHRLVAAIPPQFWRAIGVGATQHPVDDAPDGGSSWSP